MSVFKNAFVSLWMWLEVTSKNLLVFFTFLTCVFGFGDESMPFIVARGKKRKIKIGVSTRKTSKVKAVSLPVWASDVYLEDRSCLEAGLWGGRARPKAHCALKAPRATLKEHALSPLPASNGG